MILARQSECQLTYSTNLLRNYLGLPMKGKTDKIKTRCPSGIRLTSGCSPWNDINRDTEANSAMK